MIAFNLATIDQRWTAPLGIFKQCCCWFQEMGSKTTLKAWYVKRLPTVAYVGWWLINSQATDHGPHQKLRPANKSVFKQSRRASRVQQKTSQIHHKADPILGSKKRTPFPGPFSILLLRRYHFSNLEPKKGVHALYLKIGVFFLFFFGVFAAALLRRRSSVIFFAYRMLPRLQF